VAITSNAAPFTASNKTSGTSFSFTGITAAAGECVVLVVAKDNAATTDGHTNEVTSVTDALGNTWEKIDEFCNGQGAANAGATCAIFICNVTNAIAATDSITVNLSSSTTAKAVSGQVFNLAANNKLRSVGTPQVEARDAAHPGPLTFSGLTSKEYLFFRGGAMEVTDSPYTPTTNFTALDHIATSGGNSVSNMGAGGEFRILTGTGTTSDPSWSAADGAEIFIALEEFAGATGITPNSLVSASQLSSPTVTAHAAVTPDTLVSASQLGVPVVAPVIAPASLVSASLLGAPTITAHAGVTPDSLVSTSLLGVPTVTAHAVVSAASLLSTSLLGTPTITVSSASVTPNSLTSASLLGVPSVTAHAVVSPAGMTSASLLGTPTVSWKTTVSPNPLTSASQLSAPAIVAHAILTPNSMVSASQLSSPTVAAFIHIAPLAMFSASLMSSPLTTPQFDYSIVKDVNQSWIRDAYPLVHLGQPSPQQLNPTTEVP